MRLEGKVAIVAGGGPGIGEGVVKELAKEGADVAVIDISEEEAKRVACEVEKLGRKSLGIAADLTQKGLCRKAVQTTLDTFGKLDILVNVVGGAGKIRQQKKNPAFEELTEEEWDQVFTINLRTHVFMCQAVTAIFKKQRYGKIVNLGSTAGHRYHKVVNSYAIAKAAVIHFTINLAYELAPYNVNVNCVNPGSIWTPGFMEAGMKYKREHDPEKFDAELEGMTWRDAWEKRVIPRTPMGRPQTAEDVGKAVAFMVSDDAKEITGQSLFVDGGTDIARIS